VSSTAKIPVIFCTDGIFPHTVGGMQRHSRLLIEALATSNAVELTVIHPHQGIQVFAGLPNITEVALPAMPGKRHYFWETKAYSRLVMTELLKRPKQLIYAQGLSVWADAGKVKDRLIINPHGLEPFQALGLKDWLKTWPYRRVFRRLFKQAARVVSLGGSLSGILKSQGRPDNVVVLPNATSLLPLDDAALHKQPVKPMRFLFVGRFVANKGIGDLLQAAANLNAAGHQKDFVLDLAGKGPLFEEMKQRFPLPNVNFLGFVDDADLDRLYLEDQVFVLPTLFEGMPTVVLEAMARAMPILVTDTGATLELVDASNGEILPKRDAVALQGAMLRLMAMPAPDFQLRSAASLKKVQSRFTWPAVATAHLALLRDMWQSS
jgi:glycosyltransferase involved in cell wall biosynthesis